MSAGRPLPATTLVVLVVLVLGALGACEPASTSSTDPAVTLPAPAPLGPVVADRMAALDARIAAEEPPPGTADVDPEEVRGLATMVGSGGELSPLALDEARALGAGAVPPLAELARDAEASDADRGGAIEILGAMDHPDAGAVLIELVEAGEPAWVRAHAAWRLGETSQDWVVPRTILRLKYEKDHETVVWMARLLARFANFSGIAGLKAIAADEASPQREAALGSLGQILADAGFETLEELETAWIDGDPDGKLPVHEASPRLDREIWRWVDRLDEFQLRGVDDARFILERCGGDAAGMIAEALRDESLYVRVHVAQSLERMGPHAAPAGPALLAAIGDPDLGPNAVAALGGIGYAPAGPRLVSLLDPTFGPELRLAAARALGQLGDAVPAEAPAALRAVFQGDESLELRQAATESLLLLGQGEARLPFLADLLVDERVAPETTERAIRGWLVRRALAEEPDALELLRAWDELAPPEQAVSLEERRAAREARRALLHDSLQLDGAR